MFRWLRIMMLALRHSSLSQQTGQPNAIPRLTVLRVAHGIVEASHARAESRHLAGAQCGRRDVLACDQSPFRAYRWAHW